MIILIIAVSIVIYIINWRITSPIRRIWIAVTVYVLIAIVKKELGLKKSLYTILQILSVTLFEKTPILQALSEIYYKTKTGDSDKQLLLFNL